MILIMGKKELWFIIWRKDIVKMKDKLVLMKKVV
jgi:hypothetical protein